MAQIVIFAPPGEDTSAGEKALKDAGHDVEVVEATAENLLHMAIGMMGGDSEAPAEEAPAEDELPAEPEEELSAEEAAPEEKPEKMESITGCELDSEPVEVRSGKVTRLFVKELRRGEKLSFILNESSEYSFWGAKLGFSFSSPSGEQCGIKAPVRQSRFGRTYLEIGPELKHLF